MVFSNLRVLSNLRSHTRDEIRKPWIINGIENGSVDFVLSKSGRFYMNGIRYEFLGYGGTKTKVSVERGLVTGIHINQSNGNPSKAFILRRCFKDNIFVHSGIVIHNRDLVKYDRVSHIQIAEHGSFEIGMERYEFKNFIEGFAEIFFEDGKVVKINLSHPDGRKKTVLLKRMYVDSELVRTFLFLTKEELMAIDRAKIVGLRTDKSGHLRLGGFRFHLGENDPNIFNREVVAYVEKGLITKFEISARNGRKTIKPLAVFNDGKFVGYSIAGHSQAYSEFEKAEIRNITSGKHGKLNMGRRISITAPSGSSAVAHVEKGKVTSFTVMKDGEERTIDVSHRSVSGIERYFNRITFSIKKLRNGIIHNLTISDSGALHVGDGKVFKLKYAAQRADIVVRDGVVTKIVIKTSPKHTVVTTKVVYVNGKAVDSFLYAGKDFGKRWAKAVIKGLKVAESGGLHVCGNKFVIYGYEGAWAEAEVERGVPVRLNIKEIRGLPERDIKLFRIFDEKKKLIDSYINGNAASKINLYKDRTIILETKVKDNNNFKLGEELYFLDLKLYGNRAGQIVKVKVVKGIGEKVYLPVNGTHDVVEADKVKIVNTEEYMMHLAVTSMPWLSSYLKRILMRISANKPPAFLDNLIHQGFMELIKIAKNFDPRLGLPFTAFASNPIKRMCFYEIYKSLSDNGSRNHYLNISRILKAKRILRSELNREPTSEEISRQLGWSVATVDRIIMENIHSFRQQSISRPINNEGDLTLEDTDALADKSSIDAYTAFQLQEEGERVRKIKKSLIASEEDGWLKWRVLDGISGIENDETLSPADLAEELALSPEEVMEIHQEAIEKIRTHISGRS